MAVSINVFFKEIKYQVFYKSFSFDKPTLFLYFYLINSQSSQLFKYVGIKSVFPKTNKMKQNLDDNNSIFIFGTLT